MTVKTPCEDNADNLLWIHPRRTSIILLVSTNITKTDLRTSRATPFWYSSSVPTSPLHDISCLCTSLNVTTSPSWGRKNRFLTPELFRNRYPELCHLFSCSFLRRRLLPMNLCVSTINKAFYWTWRFASCTSNVPNKRSFSLVSVLWWTIVPSKTAKGTLTTFPCRVSFGANYAPFSGTTSGRRHGTFSTSTVRLGRWFWRIKKKTWFPICGTTILLMFWWRKWRGKLIPGSSSCIRLSKLIFSILRIVVMIRMLVMTMDKLLVIVTV